jgi:hypothetical protein
LCISLLPQFATATEEEAPAVEEASAADEKLPELELLGFIADFSDDEEGWVDPGELEEMFSPGSEKNRRRQGG